MTKNEQGLKSADGGESNAWSGNSSSNSQLAASQCSIMVAACAQGSQVMG